MGKMDKQQGVEHIYTALLNNEDKSSQEKTSRKTLIRELVDDEGISQTTAYEWYRDAFQQYKWEQSEKSEGYEAIHPLQMLEDAEDLLESVPDDDLESKIKLQKHYAYLVGKFKHQITFRSYETN